MIRKLRVHNFKSLRDVELELAPVTVLVGPNRGGKSNIVEVFGFIFDFFLPQPASPGLLYAMAQRAGIGEVLWKGTDEKLLSFSLEFFDNKNHAKSYSYTLEIIGGAADYSSVQRELLVLHDGGGHFPLIVEESGTRWLANRDGSRLASVAPANSALQLAPPNWEGYAVKQDVSTWRFFQLVPALMNRVNPIAQTGRLEPHGENLSAWLMMLQTRHPEAFARIEEVARDILPGFKRLLTWPSEHFVHLASEEEGLRRPVNVWQMSAGELCFIALLSLIYSPREYGAALFCVEEPENHIHPKLLETLVGLLKQVRQEIAISQEPSAQMIITTQSPYLVDHMSLDEIIWVEKKRGETRVVRPNDKQYLRKLVEDKELGLGDVVYSGILGEEK